MVRADIHQCGRHKKRKENEKKERKKREIEKLIERTSLYLMGRPYGPSKEISNGIDDQKSEPGSGYIHRAIYLCINPSTATARREVF